MIDRAPQTTRSSLESYIRAPHAAEAVMAMLVVVGTSVVLLGRVRGVGDGG